MKVDRIVKYGATRSKVLFEEGLVLIFFNTELFKYGIKEGADVPEQVYTGSILPLLCERAKERLVYILKSSDKTEAELRRKLKEGCYPEEAEECAIEWARARHYFDDERYVENYIRRSSDRKSRRAMLTDLLNKGIDKDLAESVLESAGIDEEGQILAELSRRHYDKESFDERETNKLIAALMRKGYSYSAVRDAMQRDPES